MQSGTCVHTLRGHNDEILDVTFNTTGSKLVTASADGNARVYNTMTGACQAILSGHEGEISKVAFSPQGSRVLTASSDKTARIWETETGDCLQVLEGHTDEIFSCAFNYEGDTIITGSKDNTCRCVLFPLLSPCPIPFAPSLTFPLPCPTSFSLRAQYLEVLKSRALTILFSLCEFCTS